MTLVPAIASTLVAVLAHNEERRIGACLKSLPLDDPGMAFHVVVNGTTDRTAAIAAQLGGSKVVVHDWKQGGKSRSWNRLMFDTPGIEADHFVFVDGDAQIAAGSIQALVATLKEWPEANAASGLPLNGRRVEQYRRAVITQHGLFGDLYALSGAFVANMRQAHIRLPEDLVGDDGLIGAMAKTGLKSEANWNDQRLQPCEAAGFYCEPIGLLSPAGLRMQAKRMINYSTRHFQNQIITGIMRESGPEALPVRLADLYPQWLARFKPRRDLQWWWSDRQALARMRAACAA